jgi:erythromycin esterase-like protein
MSAALIDDVVRRAIPLSGGPTDFDAVLDRVGNRRFVLLGEATHGTHEFYRVRAELTKRLIRERGFHAVAIEGDWPDALRVHRYVEGASPDPDAAAALSGFERFPAWMWRNADVLDFVGWLREHNDASERKVGFYGVDLYSLYTSIAAIIDALERLDHDAAERARDRFACFDHQGAGDVERYGYGTSLGLRPSCERAVLDQLLDLRSSSAEWIRYEGGVLEDEVFVIEQNANVVKNAERYYRTMFSGRTSTWNLRDRHMVDMLEAITTYLDRTVGRSKIVVWEHNSHLGDARATEMGAHGEWNVGQLIRERYGDEAALIGFTTYEGSVTAASGWDGPPERKAVRPALKGSWEDVFHRTGIPKFVLPLPNADERDPNVWAQRLERAIGVVYMPRTERMSHYFYADLPGQFDVVIHFDHTRAVEPLDRSSLWVGGEPPETYPFAV